VTLKLLFRDPRTGVYTALLRLAPGATFPRRRHAASEEVLVMSGLANVGTFELRAGEYCRAESESVHEPITTATGCTLFVCGSEHDEFLDDP
jgi:anti-sigma factor ChrR (cupin superfamily)